MHVTSPKHGLMVTTGVVGSGLPIANGLALAAQMRGTNQVAVVELRRRGQQTSARSTKASTWHRYGSCR
jgi:transketolase N-terminal domain/subunit